MQPFEALEDEFATHLIGLGWRAGRGNLTASVRDCVVACSSGTAALHLALEALGLPRGSRVVVPDLTMVACARAVHLAGLRPLLVDCGEDLLMDLDGLYDAVKAPGVSAVMAVHVYGRLVDMDHVETAAVSGPATLAIVEDMAELHGVAPHPATDAACWSFYRNKVIRGEEGGAVAFQDPAHAAKARRLRSLGFTDAHNFYHEPRGHNYRMANLLAAPIRESLARVNETIAVRRQIEAEYEVECPPALRMPPRACPWVYDLRIPGISAGKQNEVVRALRGAGIEARHCFKPMSTLPEFLQCKQSGGRLCDVMAREVIYLPIEPGRTTTGEVRRAFGIIRRNVL